MAFTDLTALVKTTAPKLSEALIEYIAGTVGDATPDVFPRVEELYEFFSPLLEDDLSDAEIRVLCARLHGVVGQHAADGSDGVNGASRGPQRLESGPLHMGSLAANTQAFTPGMHADITHAGAKRVATRVDERKLEKAELKLKAKMEKRKADIEVSFKIIDKPAGPKPLSDAQINEILAARGRNNDIILDNFDIAHAGLRILTNANLTLTYTRRYGLVGRNGIGKSTMLRAIVARDIVGMEKFKHVSIGHVEQELTGDDLSCVESVVKADVYREYLLRQEAQLQQQMQDLADGKALPGGDNLGSIENKLKMCMQKQDEIEASTAEARAGVILSGLGFSAEMQRRATREFSGGWKMRIALARALFTRPDILLLDEPTNHLDIPAVCWLSSYLVKWPSTLLVVSHDREFLDSVATDILHMHDERLDVYRGNFTAFESTRDERRKQAIREYDSQMQFRQHLQSFVDRWRYNAKRAAQAQSKIKILEKLPELEVPTEEVQVTFSFPDPEKISPPILQMDNVTFGYSDERTIVKGVNLDVQLTSRIAVVGPNGSGKSTALKLLTGQLEPSQGRVFRHGRLRFAFFSQHHVDALEDLNLTPVQFLAKNFPGHPEEEYRRQLGCFGISGRVGLQSLGTLSGGQKSRVVFASLALQRPSILLLDEPSNHVLDYMSVDSLADALRNFKGGVILVSHDQRFIDMVCNEIWVCDKGTINKFAGDSIKDYRDTLDIPE